MSAFTEHLRLSILRLLEGAPAYRANSSIIHGEVNRFGLAASRDQVKTELSWLAEQALVRAETVGDMVVAELTDRGVDVATGRAVVPGVQRPAARA